MQWVVRFFLAGVLLAFPYNSAFAQERAKTFTSKYITVRCQDEKELEVLEEKINIDFIARQLQGLYSFFLFGKKKELILPRLEAKLDTVLERVKLLLDMYPQNGRLTVEILPDKKELQKKFLTLYGQPMDTIAFYHNQTDTIYLSLKDVTEGVLAHEMSHFIMSHYFIIPPPMKVQEVLAQYVDLHLKD